MCNANYSFYCGKKEGEIIMLDVLTRQTYLQYLGFYKGNLDGIYGEKTHKAYTELQNKYFMRKEDRDGIYGSNTEKLLINAYNVKKYCKNFKLEEFRCKCGKHCTGYPVLLDVQFLKNLQKLRNKFGVITINSGVRCYRHNINVGGASGSRHKYGKAADIYCAKCATEAGRKKVMEYWMKLPNARYTYCNIGGNYPNMGFSVHVDVL
jgi:hypothetical protein